MPILQQPSAKPTRDDDLSIFDALLCIEPTELPYFKTENSRLPVTPPRTRSGTQLNPPHHSSPTSNTLTYPTITPRTPLLTSSRSTADLHKPVRPSPLSGKRHATSPCVSTLVCLSSSHISSDLAVCHVLLANNGGPLSFFPEAISLDRHHPETSRYFLLYQPYSLRQAASYRSLDGSEPRSSSCGAGLTRGRDSASDGVGQGRAKEDRREGEYTEDCSFPSCLVPRFLSMCSRVSDSCSL
jgi:hypothetical protein